MCVEPKNHKCEDQTELTMVPLNELTPIQDEGKNIKNPNSFEWDSKLLKKFDFPLWHVSWRLVP